MNPGEQRLNDAVGIAALIEGLARQVRSGRLGPSNQPLVLIGVRTRGLPIAERIAQRLADWGDEPARVGAVDITLYRDDLGRGNPEKVAELTKRLDDWWKP